MGFQPILEGSCTVGTCHKDTSRSLSSTFAILFTNQRSSSGCVT